MDAMFPINPLTAYSLKTHALKTKNSTVKAVVGLPGVWSLFGLS